MIALTFMVIFSIFLAMTVTTLSRGWAISNRALRVSRVRQALDAGLAFAQARLGSSDAAQFDLDGKWGTASYRVRCTPLAPDRCRIALSAAIEEGPQARAAVEIRRIKSDQGAFVWKVVQYCDAP